jgi:hypothetical protein
VGKVVELDSTPWPAPQSFSAAWNFFLPLAFSTRVSRSGVR